MITSLDPVFQETKRLKRGERRLAPPFDGLAAWIAGRWQVTVLNVAYEPSGKVLRSPRLEVVVEHLADREKLGSNRMVRFDSAKEEAVIVEFQKRVADRPGEFDCRGLFVVCSAFAPLAIEEAARQITGEELARLKAEIANPDLWRIERCFGRVTFMFLTRDQARGYEQAGMKETYSKRYRQLLGKYDEFGYLDAYGFEVQFDSKQCLDEDYGGSFFYYHR